MSCKLEPAIWSRDTRQRIPCYDRCQLIIAWMSNIKEVHSKPRSACLCQPISWSDGRHLARVHRRRRRNFPFRKQAMPSLTVDAFSDNSRCHL